MFIPLFIALNDLQINLPRATKQFNSAASSIPTDINSWKGNLGPEGP